jgi:hypothetical protein
MLEWTILLRPWVMWAVVVVAMVYALSEMD